MQFMYTLIGEDSTRLSCLDGVALARNDQTFDAADMLGSEYATLELLSLRKGTTLTKEMFLKPLYGDRDEPELKIIDVFVRKLHKKPAHASVSETTSKSFGAVAMRCAILTK